MNNQTVEALKKSIRIINALTGPLGGGRLGDGALHMYGPDGSYELESEAAVGNGVEIRLFQRKHCDHITWSFQACMIDEDNEVVQIVGSDNPIDDLNLEMTVMGHEVSEGSVHPIAKSLARIYGAEDPIRFAHRLTQAVSMGVTHIVTGNKKIVARDDDGFVWLTLEY